MTTTGSPVSISRAQLTRPDGTALRVLVVDDEQSLCERLSMALRYEGMGGLEVLRRLGAMIHTLRGAGYVIKPAA